jgi:large subunit ribosomal protein L10
MPLNYQQKQTVVAEVNAVAATALSVVGAENRGLTVAQLTELRVKARAGGVYMRVVKNTLARRAVAGTPYECISPELKGPLLLAFSKDDPGAAARILKEFTKGSDKLAPKLVSLGGQLLPAAELDRVASLPTREQALSMLVGVIKAPIEKLVRTLVAPHTKLVRTLLAVKDSRQ